MKDKEFARRLAYACDRHEMVPPYGYGRQTWIKDKMKVSHEAVRKWATGEARPRPTKMKQLAALLNVDEAWLSLGTEPDISIQGKKERSVKTMGAVNAFMGFLQLAGGHIAFPQEPDDTVNFYAILEGRHLAFHVALAVKHADGSLSFRVPVDYDRVLTVGAIRVDAFRLDFVTLSPDVISRYGTNHGGHIELAIDRGRGHYSVEGHRVDRLTSFETFTAASAAA